MYYFAAWTDSGFLLGCSHEHETIREADPCIPCAGGHVVAVGNGVMRSLTAAEEAEWQRVLYVPRTNDPAVPDEEVADDPRYAVMIRIRVVDRWTWTTWMCFETYAEALPHALEGNKVVRFRSPEYVALRKRTESAYPLVMKVPRESVPPQGEGEMFLDFVLRFLTAYGFDQASEPISDMGRSSVDPGLPLVAGQKNDSTSELDKQSSMIEPAFMAHLILSRLSESEIGQIRKIRDDDIPALLNAIRNPPQTVAENEHRCP